MNGTDEFIDTPPSNTETMNFHYQDTAEGYKVLKGVNVAVRGDAGYLPDVLAAFQDFLVSAGFTFAHNVVVESEQGDRHSAADSAYFLG